MSLVPFSFYIYFLSLPLFFFFAMGFFSERILYVVCSRIASLPRREKKNAGSVGFELGFHLYFRKSLRCTIEPMYSEPQSGCGTFIRLKISLIRVVGGCARTDRRLHSRPNEAHARPLRQTSPAGEQLPARFTVRGVVWHRGIRTHGAPVNKAAESTNSDPANLVASLGTPEASAVLLGSSGYLPGPPDRRTESQIHKLL
jgi:hypothetical protein